MAHYSRVAICAFALLLVACGEKRADVSSAKRHASNHIEFEYPGNWKVTEDESLGDVRHLFVETPGDALVVIQAMPADGTESVEKYAKEFSEKAAEATPLGTLSGSKFSSLPERAGCMMLKEEFTAAILGQSVPHQRVYAAKTTDGMRLIALLQVATEDLAKVEPGYRMILESLKWIPDAGPADGNAGEPAEPVPAKP